MYISVHVYTACFLWKKQCWRQSSAGHVVQCCNHTELLQTGHQRKTFVMGVNFYQLSLQTSGLTDSSSSPSLFPVLQFSARAAALLHSHLAMTYIEQGIYKMLFNHGIYNNEKFTKKYITMFTLCFVENSKKITLIFWYLINSPKGGGIGSLPVVLEPLH